MAATCLHTCLHDETSSEGTSSEGTSEDTGSDTNSSDKNSDNGSDEGSNDGNKGSNNNQDSAERNKLKSEEKQKIIQKGKSETLGELSHYHPQYSSKVHKFHYCCIKNIQVPKLAHMALCCKKWDAHILSLWLRNTAMRYGFQKFVSKSGHENIPIDDPNVFEFNMIEKVDYEGKEDDVIHQHMTQPFIVAVQIVPTRVAEGHQILCRRLCGTSVKFMKLLSYLSMRLQSDSQHVAYK